MTVTRVGQELRDKTAVVGVGLTIGTFPERTQISLAVEAYQKALDDCGLKRKNVDALTTYDAFAPLVLFGLERFGFCGPGEALEFIKNGRIELGGELPVNTSGGLLSEGHVVGWNLFIEAVNQLRHDCGPRQVKDAEIIQYGSFLGESIIFRR